MTITVSTDQPRTVKALAVLATADRWLRAHRKSDGSPAFIIPGSNGRVYLVDQTSCSCPDATPRGVVCKHQYAVRMRNAMMRAGVSAPAAAAEANARRRQQSTAASRYYEVLMADHFGEEG